MVHAGVSIVIVATSPILREGISSFVISYGYRLVAAITSSSDVERVDIPSDNRAVVIIEGRSDSQTAEDLEACRRRWPAATLISVSEPLPKSIVGNLMHSCADGYVPPSVGREALRMAIEIGMQKGFKTVILTELMEGLHSVIPRRAPNVLDLPGNSTIRNSEGLGTSNGHRVAPRALTPIQINGDEPRQQSAVPLSKREEQIIGWLLKGFGNKLIARKCQDLSSH
jgi:DNA-binding NarL/FixJ family response regulator